MKVTAKTDISNVEGEDDIKRFSTIFFKQAADALNGNLTIADNFKWSFVTVIFTTADTEVPVSHSLAAVPNGYILAGASVSLNLYDGDSTNTSTRLYLKSSAAGTAKVLIF